MTERDNKPRTHPLPPAAQDRAIRLCRIACERARVTTYVFVYVCVYGGGVFSCVYVWFAHKKRQIPSSLTLLHVEPKTVTVHGDYEPRSLYLVQQTITIAGSVLIRSTATTITKDFRICFNKINNNDDHDFKICFNKINSSNGTLRWREWLAALDVNRVTMLTDYFPIQRMRLWRIKEFRTYRHFDLLKLCQFSSRKYKSRCHFSSQQLQPLWHDVPRLYCIPVPFITPPAVHLTSPPRRVLEMNGGANSCGEVPRGGVDGRMLERMRGQQCEHVVSWHCEQGTIRLWAYLNPPRPSFWSCHVLQLGHALSRGDGIQQNLIYR